MTTNFKTRVQERLDRLRDFRQKGRWADPRDSSYSNVYDTAIDSEIEFLEELLSEMLEKAVHLVEKKIKL